MEADAARPESSLPTAVRDELNQRHHAQVIAVAEDPLPEGSGVATGHLALLRVILRAGDRVVEVDVVRKALAPPSGSRHAVFASVPRHWAYWRREAEAYSSGLLPSGPGLSAPRCLAVVGDELFLEYAAGPPPSVDQAARHLAAWQIDYDAAADRPWLAMDQLGQRLAVSELDWSDVDADARMVRLWDRRDEWYRTLRRGPIVLSHGDYSQGNLIARGAHTVAVDWATVGWEPIGFDLAHLALSTGRDPTDAYLSAGTGADRRAVRNGFRAATAVIGSSRVHWMCSRGRDVPDWYTDFVWHNSPAGELG